MADLLDSELEGISNLNDQLKSADVIAVPQWRAIQYLADLRNLCDHPKGKEQPQCRSTN
jgi:hypothetical protein